MANQNSNGRTSVQQAIFTSAKTVQGHGYQIVASSPGLAAQDAKALTTWCPSHDAMIESPRVTSSISFHSLPSGAFCIARTIEAGEEYSRRAGQRLHTHCLITPPDALQRFANNPFALLRAAVAQGALDVSDEIPHELPPLRLPGRAATVDRALLTWLAKEYGAEGAAQLLHTALSADMLGMAPGNQSDKVFAALLNCLPVECRTEITFSTGLKHSPRRPFRWIALDDDPAEHRQLARQFGLTVFERSSASTLHQSSTPLHGWASYVQWCVGENKLSHWEDTLRQPHPGVSLQSLGVLGARCLPALNAAGSWTSHAIRPS
jgi:hypothetical protein